MPFFFEIFEEASLLRLLAFKQRTTPLLHGVVTYISADSLQDRNTREPYYVAQIEVPESQVARLGQLTLRPGMQTEVLIETDKRTALHYIAQPILDSTNRALRED